MSIRLKNLLATSVLASLALASISSSAAESYLDNGVVKVGVDLAKGGSITYLSLSGSTNNIVNNYDLGRQIQQSYYSGPQPYNPSNNINPAWPDWPWNPIQTGDSYGNRSVVLASSNNGQMLYVKCRPMQWALSNVPGQCTFEAWLRLTNNVIIVSNRLLNARTDTTQQFAAMDQELPAVYTIGKLYRLFSYAGDAPFTGGPLTNFPSVGPPADWNVWVASESWAAMVNSSNWGLGIYSPGAMLFAGGFHGTTNSGGPSDDPTGYIAPVQSEVLDSNIEYNYTYSLILGTLQQIRDWVYAQPRRPVCDIPFRADRQHWYFTNTADTGWPITNSLHVSLAGTDPQLYSPVVAFAATNVPHLYLCAAFSMANPAGRNLGRLYWKTNDVNGYSSTRSYTFTAINDEQFHIYDLNLAASNSYRGFITQLRFDPVTAGDAGDYARVAWISPSPFAYNDAVKPTLAIALAKPYVVVGFFAMSGATAGYVGNNLLYDLEDCTNPVAGNWRGVPGFTNVVGDDSVKLFTNVMNDNDRLYRLRVSLQ